MTVTMTDVYTIAILAVVVIVILALFYKELVYVTFDEDSAKVGGIPTKLINTILIILAAITVLAAAAGHLHAGCCAVVNPHAGRAAERDAICRCAKIGGIGGTVDGE